MLKLGLTLFLIGITTLFSLILLNTPIQYLIPIGFVLTGIGLISCDLFYQQIPAKLHQLYEEIIRKVHDEKFILDDIFVWIVQNVNDGWIGMMSLWGMYMMPLSKDQRVELIYQFCFAPSSSNDEGNNNNNNAWISRETVNEIWNSPGGLTRYMLLGDSTSGKAKEDDSDEDSLSHPEVELTHLDTHDRFEKKQVQEHLNRHNNSTHATMMSTTPSSATDTETEHEEEERSLNEDHDSSESDDENSSGSDSDSQSFAIEKYRSMIPGLTPVTHEFDTMAQKASKISAISTIMFLLYLKSNRSARKNLLFHLHSIGVLTLGTTSILSSLFMSMYYIHLRPALLLEKQYKRNNNQTKGSGILPHKNLSTIIFSLFSFYNNASKKNKKDTRIEQKKTKQAIFLSALSSAICVYMIRQSYRRKRIYIQQPKVYKR